MAARTDPRAPRADLRPALLKQSLPISGRKRRSRRQIRRSPAGTPLAAENPSGGRWKAVRAGNIGGSPRETARTGDESGFFWREGRLRWEIAQNGLVKGKSPGTKPFATLANGSGPGTKPFATLVKACGPGTQPSATLVKTSGPGPKPIATLVKTSGPGTQPFATLVIASSRELKRFATLLSGHERDAAQRSIRSICRRWTRS